MFIKDLPKSWRSLAFKPARPKPLSEWEKGLAWGMAISPCATVFFGYLALAGTEETFGAVGFVIVSIIAELVCIMVSVSIVLDKTTDQNPFRAFLPPFVGLVWFFRQHGLFLPRNITRKQMSKLIAGIEANLTDMSSKTVGRIDGLIGKIAEAKTHFNAVIARSCENDDFLALARQEEARINLEAAISIEEELGRQKQRAIDELSKPMPILGKLERHYRDLIDMDNQAQGVAIMNLVEHDAAAVKLAVDDLAFKCQQTADNLEEVRKQVEATARACNELGCNEKGQSLTVGR